MKALGLQKIFLTVGLIGLMTFGLYAVSNPQKSMSLVSVAEHNKNFEVGVEGEKFGVLFIKGKRIALEIKKNKDGVKELKITYEQNEKNKGIGNIGVDIQLDKLVDIQADLESKITKTFSLMVKIDNEKAELKLRNEHLESENNDLVNKKKQKYDELWQNIVKLIKKYDKEIKKHKAEIKVGDDIAWDELDAGNELQDEYLAKIEKLETKINELNQKYKDLEKQLAKKPTEIIKEVKGETVYKKSITDANIALIALGALVFGSLMGGGTGMLIMKAKREVEKKKGSKK